MSGQAYSYRTAYMYMYAAARTCMFPWYMYVVSEMLSLVVLRSAICVTHSNCHHQASFYI